MPIGTYTPPLWKTITQKIFSIFFILFFHFRCILLQISHKKCFFISISILGRSGVKIMEDRYQGHWDSYMMPGLLLGFDESKSRYST